MKRITCITLHLLTIAGIVTTTGIASIATVGSTTDAWDVSQGTHVIYNTVASDTYAEAMFGRLNANDDPEAMMFCDGAPESYGHLLVWETPAPVHITGFTLYGGGQPWANDPSVVLREFDVFELWAWNTVTPAWDLVYTYDAPNPNTDPLAYTPLVHTASVDVTAQRFMAKFTQVGPQTPSNLLFAPRIVELDAITSVPEPASLLGLVSGIGALGLARRLRKRII